VASWIRRPFSAPGLTQIPPGPHLRALQGRFGGTVMLCIDNVTDLADSIAGMATSLKHHGLTR
jgi:hypothetical protein